MDAVITYVDGLDPLWQKDYLDSMGGSAMAKRFRDWGTLKYLLRGIEVHLPFVQNVWLVVSRDSQVPEWASENLKIVRHKDIIPDRFLPVFNSTAIEMFLHRIPGLDEHFLYFNDDMFPVRDCREESFYMDGKCAMGFSRSLFYANLYKKQSRNSDVLSRKALGRRPGLTFMRPQHTCSPMIRSASEALYRKVEKEILDSVTRIREPKNLNQYLFLDYLYYSGQAVNRRLSNKHLSLATASIDQICSFLANPTCDLVCINDVHMDEAKFQTYRKRMLEAFEKAFPRKSRFEL